jgi:Tfp pilus assembly protein PilX
MASATRSKGLSLNIVVLTALIVLALFLTGYFIYTLTHHSTDNFSIDNHQTQLDQPINTGR